MKHLILICVTITLLLATSCARVTVQTVNTDHGTDWTIEYNTFFRAVEDVSAGNGPAQFYLGRANSDVPTPEDIACALSPQLCQ